jgi:preprotein translocase subunit SecD
MFNSLKARFAVIAALLLVCGYMLFDRGIVLGLDLQGGTHLAMEVRDPANALTTAQREDAIDRALRVIRTRIDELGVAEPVIQKVGATASWCSCRARAWRTSGAPGHPAADGVPAVPDRPAAERPRGRAAADGPGDRPGGAGRGRGRLRRSPRPRAGFRRLYLLEARPMITGEYLEDAQAQRDPQLGQPRWSSSSTAAAAASSSGRPGRTSARRWRSCSTTAWFSAPVIRGQIGTRGQIELGGAAIEEARDLALVLRAGALPAPLEIIEERSVGPSLGQDSIDRGRVAGMIGIIARRPDHARVLPRFSGVMAVVALALYVLFVLGGLAGIGATLTLPGIAGLILSIGMAVDANVLIFERIREELADGAGARAWR